MRTFNRVILLFIVVYIGVDLLWWIPRVVGFIPAHHTPVLDYLLTSPKGIRLSQLGIMLLLLFELYGLYYFYAAKGREESLHVKTESGNIFLSYRAIEDYVNHHVLLFPEFKSSRTQVKEINEKLTLNIVLKVRETENLPLMMDKRLKEIREYLVEHFGNDYLSSVHMSVGKIIPGKKKKPV